MEALDENVDEIDEEDMQNLNIDGESFVSYCL